MENEIPSVNRVDQIHEELASLTGSRIRVRANMGRSKIVESEGVLTQVHPRLFVMEVDRKRGRKARQSYQYVDVLTGTVEGKITVNDPNSPARSRVLWSYDEIAPQIKNLWAFTRS